VVNQGTVRKSGGGGISYITAPFYNSATLDVRSGTLNLTQGEGDGVFEAEAGATLNFSGNYELEGVIKGEGTILLSGSMTGTNGVVSGGVLTWIGGSIGSGSTLRVATNGVLVVSGASYHDLHGVLTNAGTIQLTNATYLRCFGDTGAGRLINLPGALVDFQDDSWIYYYYGNEAVVNQGTVRKSGGSGISYIYPAFYNSGLLDVQTGGVSIYTGEGGGVFEVEAGATLNFANNYTADSGAIFMGGGTNVISGGTFTLNGVMTNSNLMQAGGNLSGNNAVISSFWKWTGGGVYGTVAVATNGMLVVSGASYHDLHGALTNAGTIQLTNATCLRCVGDSGAGRLVNLPGALVDFQDDSWIYYYYGSEAVVSQGTVRKSGGSGISCIYPAFYNSGTVEAQNGTIQFIGSYAETSSANILFSPGGPTPGSDFGQIHFSTALTLAGKFTVSMRNGFRPNPGDSFSVLSYPSVTGDFSCMNGLDLGNGLQLAPRFGKTGLTLVAVAHATNALPSMSLSLTPGGTLVLWPQDFIGWQLEMTTNLTTPDWAPVTVSGTNNTIVPRTGSEGYFRLKSN
jgi:hypothetical protein